MANIIFKVIADDGEQLVAYNDTVFGTPLPDAMAGDALAAAAEDKVRLTAGAGLGSAGDDGGADGGDNGGVHAFNDTLQGRNGADLLVGDVLGTAILAALAISIIAFISGVLDLLTTGRYLPSHEWLRYSRPTANTVLTAWFFLIFLVTARTSKHRDANAYVDGVFVAMLLVGFFFIPFGNLFHRTIPALLDSISVNEVEHSYTIRNATAHNDKWCHNPVDLQDMPPMVRLCDVSFRTGLASGDNVTFGGFGSWRGLFVEYVQP